MAKGFFLIILCCCILRNCVSDDLQIELYTVPTVITDTVETPTLYCIVDSSIDVDSVNIYHNGKKMPSTKDHDHNMHIVFLDTTKDYSGDYTCLSDEDNRNETLNIIIHPTCIELGSLNETTVDDFSKRLNQVNQADLETCLKKALHRIVNLTSQLDSMDNTPPTDPPQAKETPIQTINATVNMTVNGSEIPVGDDLHVSCTTTSTIARNKVKYSWRWTEWRYINSTEDPNMNAFDWSVVLRNGTNGTITSWTGRCGDSNSTCEGSNLTISPALVERSGRFLCVAEFPHGVGSMRYSDIRVVNPINNLRLIRNGIDSNQTVPIVIPHGSPLEVSCNATGEYAAPDTVNIKAHIDSKAVILGKKSSSDTKTTTAKLTIPWEKIEGKVVEVLCEAIGDYKSNRGINATVEVSKAPPGGPVPTDTTTNNITSAPWGSFGTPTVFGGIATVLVVVVVIGVVVVAYRSRDKLRTWIMEKDVSKAAVRKAKYARARGGKGWIKYAKLPRDISEAMSHNE